MFIEVQRGVEQMNAKQASCYVVRQSPAELCGGSSNISTASPNSSSASRGAVSYTRESKLRS
jgi:hypothetical protein